MGMGYSSCVGHSISYEDLKDLLPNEVAAIEQNSSFEDWGTLADEMSEPELPQDLKNLVYNLYEAFSKVTEVDGSRLKLNLVHYDEDAGERYDEVNHWEGCVFEVYEVHQLTPAGRKFQDRLETFSFVTFG